MKGEHALHRFMKSVMIACLTSLIVLAGCSAGGGSAQPQNQSGGGEAKKEPAAKNVTLKISIWGNENYKTNVQKVADKFTAKHPHIKVEVILIPLAEYQQKLSIMIASKTAPDLVWMAQRHLPQFMEAGQLEDIGKIKEDAAYNFMDNLQSGFYPLEKDGKLYGIPFTNPPKVLFFNKSMFKEKGLKTPLELYKEGKWTYDEFLRAAQAMTDPAQGSYGAYLITANGWKQWYDSLLDTFWAFGAEFMNEDGSKFLLNSPQGEQALQYYSDLIFKHKVHPKPGDQITFESGKIGISRQNYGYANSLRTNNVNFEWDVAPMPKGPVKDAAVADGVAAYAMLKDSANKTEALELLKHMTSQEGMTDMASLFVPNRKSVLESGALTKGHPFPSQEGIQAAIIDALNGKTRPNLAHKNFQQIDIKVQTLMDTLYTQSMSVKDLLKKMEEEVDPLLK